MTEDRGPVTGSRDAWSSVELTRGQRGSYGWNIKIYVPAGEEDSILPKLVRLEAHLHQRFGTPATDEGMTA